MRNWLHSYLNNYAIELVRTVLKAHPDICGCSVLISYREDNGKVLSMIHGGTKHDDAKAIAKHIQESVSGYLEQQALDDGDTLEIMEYEQPKTPEE